MEEIKEAQYTNIRCHNTKFSRPADLAPRICAAHYEGSYAGTEENNENGLVGDVDIFATRRFNKHYSSCI